jgi:hypothetical protein
MAMNDRIHRYLDGELPREQLSADELARAAEMEAAIMRATADLRAMHAPDLVGRVMSALPAAALAAAPALRPDGLRWARAWSWLWNPRPVTISFRPAYGMLALLALALGVQGLPLPARDGGERMAVSSTPPPVYVQFRLNAAGAQHVSLAGTFTGWKPGYTLHETSPGVWTAMVALRPGVHDYAFVVDGRWVSDPSAPQVDDSFGGTNSRISLPPIVAS